MGGIGTGRKKSAATLAKMSAEQIAADQQAKVDKAAQKIVAGPWCEDIPAPEMPLEGVGLKKYNELARMLFDQRKLTKISLMQAEAAAVMFAKIHALVSAGKSPSANDQNQYQRALTNLKVADEARTISEPGKTNRFKPFGFSARRSAAK